MNELVAQTLSAYKNFFTDEKGSFGILDEQIAHKEDLIDRKNMHGHVTASGLVIAPDGRVLLIFHKASQQYQQPGGHIDTTDSNPIAAAMREVREEAGLKDIALHEWHTTHPFPINIDTHPIAPRKEKNEGDHFHHDFLYLFTTASTDTTAQVEEVDDLVWVDSDDSKVKRPHIQEAIGKACSQGVFSR